jgi:tetratricopeptide (TPR) repeat protein
LSSAAVAAGAPAAASLDVLPLWDFDHPERSEQRFRAALPTVAGDDRLILLTQIARTYSLRGWFDDAHRLLDRIEAVLPQSTTPAVRVRYHLERGRSFRSAGQLERARPHFDLALTIAQATGEEALALDAIHMLALGETGDAALELHRRGIAAARAAKDPAAQRWAVSMLNNLGLALREQGRLAEALAVFEDNQREAERLQLPARRDVARWQIARTLREMRRHEEALSIQRQLEAGSAQVDGFVLEEIAELLHALGRTAEARPYFARAHTLLSQLPAAQRPPPERLARLRALGRP